MTKILHLNAGTETGGGMVHILSLLKTLDQSTFILGVMEEGEMMHEAKQSGIQTINFQAKRRVSMSLLQRIRTYIKQENIRCIHTHGPRANVYGYILRKTLPIHWITTIHSDPSFDFKGRGPIGFMWEKMHIRVLQEADRVIGISKAFTKRITEVTNIDPQKIVTTYNGIDFEDVSSCDFAREDFRISDDAMVFIIVGRLEEVKGHSVAIKAFASFLENMQNSYLLIVGSGAAEQKLKEQVFELDLETSVLFLGNRKDAPTLYELADVKILPSYSESFPLVLLESARTKTPVIASDVGGVGELITKEGIGWKVSAGDVQQLYQAMIAASEAKSSGELQKIGEKFQIHASNKFSLENFAENVYNVYKELLV